MIFCAKLGRSATETQAMIRQVFREESTTRKSKLTEIEDGEICEEQSQ
jgi:hypothetical protein